MSLHAIKVYVFVVSEKGHKWGVDAKRRLRAERHNTRAAV